MGVVTNIVTAIKSQVETASGYTELNHQLTVDKNKYAGAEDKYGVLPDAAVQVDGVTKAITVDQTFEIILVTGYSVNKVDDSDARTKALTLSDKLHDCYKLIVQQKAGIPNTCMYLGNLSVEAPEYLEDDKVVILRGSFELRYRYLL